jgi:hypothetical protein
MYNLKRYRPHYAGRLGAPLMLTHIAPHPAPHLAPSSD